MTSDQVASDRPPRIHEYTACSVWECCCCRYVCTAVSSAATATPASRMDPVAPLIRGPPGWERRPAPAPST